MNYRPEIDGLRTIAVLPVIFFHAKFPFFTGGYIGVDVFFVISGFLITSIIIHELNSNTFSIGKFYERRARRILPALFTVVFVSIILSWVSLFPVEMKDFSQSLIAVSTFSSNILFWIEADYWATISELKPLLHTWSLAVEEQYYLFFPLLMLLSFKLNKKFMFIAILLLLFLSLYASTKFVASSPQAAFYLLPFRAWELLVGSFGAFLYNGNQYSFKPNSSLSNLGFCLIVGSIFYYDKTTPFPSVSTLLPTIGTLMVILFIDKKSYLYNLLTQKHIVFIGLLSYSGYLWHQPLFAFVRNFTISEPSHFVFSFLIILTFLIAYLSWRFIEKPFRMKGKISSTKALCFSVVGLVAIFTFGLIGHQTKGFQSRDNGIISMRNIADKIQVNKGLSYACDGAFTRSDECRTAGKPIIAIWGDSFAMHLVKGIQASNSEAEIIQHTLSGCSPIEGLAAITKSGGVEGATTCLDFNKSVKDWLAENKVEYVVLSSAFNATLNFRNDFLTQSGEVVRVDHDEVVNAWASTLEFIESLGSIPVVVSPPPSTSFNIGACLAKSDWFGGDKKRCNFTNDSDSISNSKVFDFLDNFKQQYKYHDLKKMICDDFKCYTSYKDIYFYRDSGHLSIEGVEYLGEKYNFYKLITE